MPEFVNPKYTELYGQPCYPSLDALPERPDIALVALNPLRAAMVTRDAAAAGIPAVIIPGGGVVEGGAAAAAVAQQCGVPVWLVGGAKKPSGSDTSDVVERFGL